MAISKYFYCIIDSNEKETFGPLGVGGNGDEVYVIPYRDIGGVVSNISLEEIDPDEKNALTHMDVIQRVMEQHTVLPLKFGTVFKDNSSVIDCLSKIYRQIKTEIIKLEGKSEVGVRVLWSPENAREFITKTDEKLKEMEKEMQSMSEGKAYLQRIKIEQLITNELNQKSEQFAQNIFHHISKHALKSVQSNLVGHVILNSSFLIPKESVETFKNVVESLKSEWLEKHVEVNFTGPWPPYNFTNIRYE